MKPKAIVKLWSEQSPEPVASHGGHAVGTHWTLTVEGVLLGQEYCRHKWSADRAKYTRIEYAPSNMVDLFNKLCAAFDAPDASPAGVKPLEGEEYRRVMDAAIAAYETNTPPTYRYSATALCKAVEAAFAARIMSAIEPAGVGVETPPPSTHVRVSVADEELAQWAEKRADDAGRLARELIAYRRGVVSADVADLVVAAREFWERHNDICDDSRALDVALEAFASRVPYGEDANG